MILCDYFVQFDAATILMPFVYINWVRTNEESRPVNLPVPLSFCSFFWKIEKSIRSINKSHVFKTQSFWLHSMFDFIFLTEVFWSALILQLYFLAKSAQSSNFDFKSSRHFKYLAENLIHCSLFYTIRFFNFFPLQLFSLSLFLCHIPHKYYQRSLDFATNCEKCISAAILHQLYFL